VVAITLRDARRGDELAVAELHVRSWQEAYRELMPAEFLAALDPRERAERYEFEGGEEAPRTVVAVSFGEEGTGLGGGGVGLGEEGTGNDLSTTRGGEGAGDDPSLTNSVEVRSGSSPAPFDRAVGGSPGGGLAEAIIGFATFGPSRDADAAGLGEIYALYVDPESYGGGTGRLLMAEARRRLREAGMQEAILWVLRGNERAQLFYEREGWRADGATRFEQPYGIVSNVIRFRRTLD
jgi:ribosomal protein S18 acetylase RimI-like enzyme